MKKLKAPLIALFLFLLISPKAFAVCPVCTIAVGAGLGLSRWLGIDDTVSGLWIGGLILSTGLWMDAWLEKKNFKVKFRAILSVVLMYLFTIVPLYFGKIFGHPYNKIWGMDKLAVGITVGSVLFVMAVLVDKLLRRSNEGKVYFPYQKVILPVGMLLLFSFAFYFVTR